MLEVILSTYNFKNLYHTEVRFGQMDIAMSKEDGIQVSRAVNKENNDVFNMSLVSRTSLGLATSSPSDFWTYLQQLRRHKNEYNVLSNNCRHISILVIDYLNPPGATNAVMELTKLNRKLRLVQFVAKELVKPLIQFVFTILTSLRFISTGTALKSMVAFDWLMLEADGARERFFSFINEVCPTLDITEHLNQHEMTNLNIYSADVLRAPTTFTVKANPAAMAITLIVMSAVALILALSGKFIVYAK